MLMLNNLCYLYLFVRVQSMVLITSKLRVNRSVIDKVEGLQGSCNQINAIKTANGCQCRPNHTFSSDIYNSFSCLTKKTVRCDIGTTTDRYLKATSKSVRLFGVSREIKHCAHHNSSVYVMNFQQQPLTRALYNNLNTLRGQWTDITKMVAPYFRIINDRLIVDLDRNIWQGQLIKVNIDCLAQCVVMKFEGSVVYPYDINKLRPHSTKLSKMGNGQGNDVKGGEIQIKVIACICLFISALIVSTRFLVPLLFQKKEGFGFIDRLHQTVRSNRKSTSQPIGIAVVHQYRSDEDRGDFKTEGQDRQSSSNGFEPWNCLYKGDVDIVNGNMITLKLNEKYINTIPIQDKELHNSAQKNPDQMCDSENLETYETDA